MSAYHRAARPRLIVVKRCEMANAHGHLRALDAGWLSGPALEVRGISIQAGDRVLTLRNDRRLGVRNGNRGVVLDVDTDERTMRVQLPNRVVGYVHLSRLEPR